MSPEEKYAMLVQLEAQETGRLGDAMRWRHVKKDRRIGRRAVMLHLLQVRSLRLSIAFAIIEQHEKGAE